MLLTHRKHTLACSDTDLNSSGNQTKMNENPGVYVTFPTNLLFSSPLRSCLINPFLLSLLSKPRRLCDRCFHQMWPQLWFFLDPPTQVGLLALANGSLKVCVWEKHGKVSAFPGRAWALSAMLHCCSALQESSDTGCVCRGPALLAVAPPCPIPLGRATKVLGRSQPKAAGRLVATRR